MTEVDAAEEKADAGVDVFSDAVSDAPLLPPAAPWSLYACYYGPPTGIPPLMACGTGLSYVTCVLNGQYVGFCDGSADCKKSAVSSDTWVCPAEFVSVNPGCMSMFSKYSGSHVYVCGDAGGPTGE